MSLIEFLQIELDFQINGLYKLAPFPGSMWRGGFGIELKKLSCAHHPLCPEACRKPDRCAYGVVFESQRDDLFDTGHQPKQAPRPFSIYPITRGPALLEPGAILKLQMCLWGDALQFFPYIALAWRNHGLNGLNPGHVKADLVKITDTVSGKVLFDQTTGIISQPQLQKFIPQVAVSDHRIRLTTQSPIRMKTNGRLIGKNPAHEGLTSRALLIALYRRVNNCFPGADLGTDPEELIASLDKFSFSGNDTEWMEITRYSHRQKDHLQMGGLNGSIEWDRLPGIWLPLLRLAEKIQIGKGTTMGLGKYQINEEIH